MLIYPFIILIICFISIIFSNLFILYIRKCMKDSPFTFSFPLSKRCVYPNALLTVPNTCSTIICLVLYSYIFSSCLFIFSCNISSFSVICIVLPLLFLVHFSLLGQFLHAFLFFLLYSFSFLNCLP